MKSAASDTRNSLILRLHDNLDVEAWEQFVAIYEPLIYRLARAKGFQNADAQEIIQEVFIAVAGAVDRWEPDNDRGRFRDWLFKIARNMMINFMTRKRHRSIGSGDSRIANLLNQQPANATEQSAEFDFEYRREVFRWAADQVRDQVKDNTWQAFWQTSVESQSAQQVAEQLGMTIGAVHIARSRVRSRLRAAVSKMVF